MRTHVEVERRPAGERLVTACVVTLVRSLARMRSPMAGETARVPKPLPTTGVFATVWTLPCMDSDVHV